MATGRPTRDDDLALADTLSAAEVAAMLGVSRQAVQARARRQTLRAFKDGAGEWRIPAQVAKALVSAEHHRGLSAANVRALPIASARLVDEAGAAGISAALEARLAGYEARLAEHDRRVDELLARHRDELAVKDAQLTAAREETARFRQALLALAGRPESAG